MKHFAICSLIILTFLSFTLAQQPGENYAWDVPIQQNITARSNLTVQNRCGQTHNFRIEKQNVPFLNFSQTEVSVGGGQNVDVPVQFDTRELSLGVHEGAILVVCLTCSSEPTCTQDRERLLARINVVAPQHQPNDNTETPKTTDKTPRVTAISENFKKNPCPELANECDKLKQKAAKKESEATDAQNKANDAKSDANAADKKAKAAEAEARKKQSAATPPPDGGTVTDENRGETYTQADSDYLEAQRQALFAEYQAGNISAAEQQRRREELSGPDALKNAREERLANLEKLKKEAEAAKKAAEKERARAEKVAKQAEKEQKKADKAKAEADKAIGEYDKCIKRLEEECRKKQEAIAKAEKERKEREARAAAAQAEAERKKREEAERIKREEERRALIAEENRYLLDNIKKLGLINSAPFEDTPGAFDAVIDHIIPDILGKTAEGVVTEMVQGAAEYTANTPIPISSIQALGGLYQIFAKRFDPCSPLGAPRITDDLEGMTNPKTGANYTGNEALAKVDKMCKLLKELQKKVQEIKRLQEKQKNK